MVVVVVSSSSGGGSSSSKRRTSSSSSSRSSSSSSRSSSSGGGGGSSSSGSSSSCGGGGGGWGGGGVDLIQTKQKGAAREQRNKCKPRTETRTTPSNQTGRRIIVCVPMFDFSFCLQVHAEGLEATVRNLGEPSGPGCQGFFNPK